MNRIKIHHQILIQFVMFFILCICFLFLFSLLIEKGIFSISSVYDLSLLSLLLSSIIVVTVTRHQKTDPKFILFIWLIINLALSVLSIAIINNTLLPQQLFKSIFAIVCGVITGLLLGKIRSKKR